MEKNKREIDLRKPKKAAELLNEILSAPLERQNLDKVLDEVISLDPRNARALQLRGRIKHRLGQNESALEDLNAADELQPDDEDTIFYRAEVYYQLNRLRDAYVDFTYLGELDPAYISLRDVRSDLLQGVPFQELQIIKQLASGGFGQVSLAMWKGKEVALKTPLQVITSDEHSALNVNQDQLIAEAMTSMYVMITLSSAYRALSSNDFSGRKLRHKNIVSALGLCRRESGEVSFIMEYACDGSLDLLYTKQEKLTNEKILRYAHDIASGLAYLHKRRVIHRDLKSANILLFDNKSCAKICDFGQSRFLNEKSVAKTVVGTIGYIAPEVLAEKDYDEKADIYSFGVLLYEMCTNRPLPTIATETDRMNKIRDDLLSKCAEDKQLYRDIQELIFNCCQTDPVERPTSKECFDKITKLLEEFLMVQEKRRSAAGDIYYSKFHELLQQWEYLCNPFKQSLASMLLSLKYEGTTPVATDKLIPVGFAFKEELIQTAMQIVSNYRTDAEMEKQIEFAPLYIREKHTPPALTLLSQCKSSINVLLIGENHIGKSKLAYRFCNVPRERGRGIAGASNPIVFKSEGRAVRLYDAPGFSKGNDKRKDLWNFILKQLSNRDSDGKIDLVLLCFKEFGFAPQDRCLINAIADILPVLAHNMNINSRADQPGSDSSNGKITFYQADGGLHKLARAMAKELLKSESQSAELTQNSELDTYYEKLKEEGRAIISRFAKVQAHNRTVWHALMFAAILRLYRTKDPEGRVELIVQHFNKEDTTTLGISFLNVLHNRAKKGANWLNEDTKKELEASLGGKH